MKFSYFFFYLLIVVLQISEEWIPLVEICYDKSKSLAIYSRHLIHGAGLIHERWNLGRPAFSLGDDTYYQGFSPKEAYSKKNQQHVFSNLFGKNHKMYLDFNTMHYLERQQLTPAKDFMLAAHQVATFFYINAAPQWASINMGNWIRVEENVRDLAMELKIDLEVVTGTEKVLKLNGLDSKKEIWLHNFRLPVPKYFWKIARNPRENSCIAFISINNPFKSTPKTMCKDICQEHGWPVLKDQSKGYVYCCEYQDLKIALPDLYPLVCKSILGRKQEEI